MYSFTTMNCGVAFDNGIQSGPVSTQLADMGPSRFEWDKESGG
ncbi:hypothetical protein SAMN04490355_102522 [Pelosinus propionicus DSM 13327]|uniref:Uncharacterized protein n=1 Tax=Pelosinus propionicus DSM 13327 TaxID=1123291 RepID=A0A1I4LJA4_9FIRM|nr:hypothetical protein SAMN04490355_102522 [Pelosinus propionicus DSM 13327]